MLSKEFLLSRGSCCGNKCTNCPYYPKYKKGAVMNEKVIDLLEDIAYTNYISENSRSEDYCTVCGKIWGNVDKCTFPLKHEDECIVTRARDILKQINKK